MADLVTTEHSAPKYRVGQYVVSDAHGWHFGEIVSVGEARTEDTGEPIYTIEVCVRESRLVLDGRMERAKAELAREAVSR